MKEIIIRGGYVKRGTCIVCGGDVLEALPTGPCGQQVTLVTYKCHSCGLHGSSHLWLDAWGVATLREKVKSAISKFRELSVYGPDPLTYYYDPAEVDALVEELEKI